MGYSDDAQKEAIDLMVAKIDALRIRYIRDRLRKTLEDHQDDLEEAGRARAIAEHGHARGLVTGKGARAEFVRIAMLEVAPKRKLRAWRSEVSGRQTLYVLLKGGPNVGMRPWVGTLLEATMDHIDGLKWGEIDESRRARMSTVPETQFAGRAVEPEPEPEPEPIWETVALVPTVDGVKEAYASILLDHLCNSPPDKLPKEVLDRLDRMVGLA